MEQKRTVDTTWERLDVGDLYYSQGVLWRKIVYGGEHLCVPVEYGYAAVACHCKRSLVVQKVLRPEAA